MSVSVDLEELAGELERRSNAAYLLTVGDNGAAHCVASTIAWAGDDLLIAAGGTSLHNASARGSVVLLAPPSGGLLQMAEEDHEGNSSLDSYSLIVDAEVTGTLVEDRGGDVSRRADGWVRTRPTHAVFHRPAVAPEGNPHDCIRFYDEATPAV